MMNVTGVAVPQFQGGRRVRHSSRCQTRLVTRALGSALKNHGHPGGVMFHSDNGSRSSPRRTGEALPRKSSPSTAPTILSPGPEGKQPAAGNDAAAESPLATLKKDRPTPAPRPTRKDLTDALAH
jgi:transposase InsO family protein